MKKGCIGEIENMMGRLNKSCEECRGIYVEQKIVQAFKTITIEKCCGFHDHSQTFFQRCLNKETLKASFLFYFSILIYQNMVNKHIAYSI